MTAITSPHQASIPDEVYSVTLKGGLRTQRGNKTEVVYNRVRLRHTDTADERMAVAMAERVVTVQGLAKLLVSDAEYKFALNYLHIESFENVDGGRLNRGEFTVEMVGRLDPLDWSAIEDKVFMVELAAQLRYGLIEQATFDKILTGTQPKPAPQPVGPAADTGGELPQSVPGPRMLTGNDGTRADGAAALDGGQAGR